MIEPQFVSKVDMHAPFHFAVLSSGGFHNGNEVSEFDGTALNNLIVDGNCGLPPAMVDGSVVQCVNGKHDTSPRPVLARFCAFYQW